MPRDPRTPSTHPFARWLLDQSKRDDNVGDLARAVIDDGWDIPVRATLSGLLDDLGAPEQRRALKRAWREWRLWLND